MRLRFEEQLNNLNREMIAMGALSEDAIGLSIRALSAADGSLFDEVSETVERINHKEREIEDMCLKILMQQQPVAKDLRTISAALKMVSDLERIGDQSEDIAEIVSMQGINREDDKFEILDMAAAASKMVTEAVDAFVIRDAAKAKSVIASDDTVDEYFNHIKIELAHELRESGKNPLPEAVLPGNGLEKALDLLMISKYLERIGDHAVNIAQWVIFMVTGVLEGNTK